MPQVIRSAGITGTGSYLPDKVLTNADLEKMVDTSDEWILTRTGIKERRIAAPEQATSDLAFNAARAALTMAGLKPEQLNLIIVATITPDHIYPSTACLIQHKLGAVNAATFDLEAACSGFVYALSVARQFIATGAAEAVLVVGAETLSRVVDWTDRNNCVLMGDGAGAAVVQPVPEGSGILETVLWADGGLSSLLEIPAGGSRLPSSHATIDQRLNFMKINNGKEVFKNGVIRMGLGIDQVLAKAGLKREDIDLLVPHQANKRILDALADRLKLPPEKVFINIHKCGNTSAASCAIALDEAVRSGRIKKGDIVVLTAFGGGLTMGTGLIRW